MESIKDKGLSVFKDNVKGSITFVAWRRKIITHAAEWGGETAKQVMLGQLAGVPPDENIDKCNLCSSSTRRCNERRVMRTEDSSERWAHDKQTHEQTTQTTQRAEEGET